MSPKLEAVVEYYPPDNFKAWAILQTKKYIFIRLWGQNTPEEIGSVVAQIADYNQINTNREAKKIIEKLLEAESLIVGGGIQAVDANSKIISPGCCCGLEEWSDWLKVNNKNQSLWLGHDPAPWIEYLPEADVLRIWEDGGIGSSLNNSSKKLRHIDFSMQKFKINLKQVRTELNDFVVVLGKWAKQFDELLAKDFMVKFRQDFDINQ
jgi:hypothetical protein